MTDSPSSRRFGGIARLYGEPALQRLSQAHVCVVGLGGVGSWAAEALARSGVGALTLIDLDNVAESNVNRQLHALTDNFGKAKTTALAERIGQINPTCRVSEIEDFVTEENLPEIFRRPFDFVIDAIDQVRVKAAMAAHFVHSGQPFVLSGGAGGQRNPAHIRTADLSAVTTAFCAIPNRKCASPASIPSKTLRRRKPPPATPRRRGSPARATAPACSSPPPSASTAPKPLSTILLPEKGKTALFHS